MSTLITIFLFPIGLYFYFFQERPYLQKYNEVFDNFHKKIAQNNNLSKPEKKYQYSLMLKHNNYKVLTYDEYILGEKKLFSVSLFAAGIGIYFVGALIYIIYYIYFQKPHRVTFNS